MHDGAPVPPSYIEFTNEDGSPVLVRMEQIVEVESKNPNGTVLIMKHEPDDIVVQESYDEVLALMNDCALRTSLFIMGIKNGGATE